MPTESMPAEMPQDTPQESPLENSEQIFLSPPIITSFISPVKNSLSSFYQCVYKRNGLIGEANKEVAKAMIDAITAVNAAKNAKKAAEAAEKAAQKFKIDLELDIQLAISLENQANQAVEEAIKKARESDVHIDIALTVAESGIQRMVGGIDMNKAEAEQVRRVAVERDEYATKLIRKASLARLKIGGSKEIAKIARDAADGAKSMASEAEEAKSQAIIGAIISSQIRDDILLILNADKSKFDNALLAAEDFLTRMGNLQGPFSICWAAEKLKLEGIVKTIDKYFVSCAKTNEKAEKMIEILKGVVDGVGQNARDAKNAAIAAQNEAWIAKNADIIFKAKIVSIESWELVGYKKDDAKTIVEGALRDMENQILEQQRMTEEHITSIPEKLQDIPQESPPSENKFIVINFFKNIFSKKANAPYSSQYSS